MSETQADPAAPPQAHLVTVRGPKAGEGKYDITVAADGKWLRLDYRHPTEGAKLLGEFPDEASARAAAHRQEGYLSGFHAGVQDGFKAARTQQESRPLVCTIGKTNVKVSIERFESGWIVRLDDRPLEKHHQHTTRDAALISAGYEVHALERTTTNHIVLEHVLAPPSQSGNRRLRFERDAEGKIVGAESEQLPAPATLKKE